MKFPWFKPKPVIVCIHGFGVRRTHEYDGLVAYFSQKGYTCILPELFDQTNINDIDPTQWIERAKDSVRTALSSSKEVVLIGFSMGGVIATSIAAEFPIKKLVLIAPAFEYITLRLVKKLVTSKVSARWVKPLPKGGPYPAIPEHFNNTFTEVVSLCKPFVSKVICPTLILHGSKDEKIPLRSSEFVFSMIASSMKKRFIFEGVAHRLLDDPIYQNDAYHLIHQHIK